MVTKNTAEVRDRCSKERAAKAAEEAAAQKHLEEERTKAAAVAVEAKRLGEETAAEAKRLKEETAVVNKWPRVDGGKSSEVDLMGEENSKHAGNTNAHIQQMNRGAAT